MHGCAPCCTRPATYIHLAGPHSLLVQSLGTSVHCLLHAGTRPRCSHGAGAASTHLPTCAGRAQEVGAWAGQAAASHLTVDLPFDARAMAVVEGAMAMGALPPLNSDVMLDLRELSPNLAQAMLQARLCSLSAMFAATGCAPRCVPLADGALSRAALLRHCQKSV